LLHLDLMDDQVISTEVQTICQLLIVRVHKLTGIILRNKENAPTFRSCCKLSVLKLPLMMEIAIPETICRLNNYKVSGLGAMFTSLEPEGLVGKQSAKALLTRIGQLNLNWSTALRRMLRHFGGVQCETGDKAISSPLIRTRKCSY
jgi:hypothetical protein